MTMDSDDDVVESGLGRMVGTGPFVSWASFGAAWGALSHLADGQVG